MVPFLPQRIPHVASQIYYTNIVSDSNGTIVCSDALRPRLSNRGSYDLLDILRFYESVVGPFLRTF